MVLARLYFLIMCLKGDIFIGMEATIISYYFKIKRYASWMKTDKKSKEIKKNHTTISKFSGKSKSYCYYKIHSRILKICYAS